MELWQIYHKPIANKFKNSNINTFYNGCNYVLSDITPEVCLDFADWIKENNWQSFEMEGISSWLQPETGERKTSTALYGLFLKQYKKPEYANT